MEQDDPLTREGTANAHTEKREGQPHGQNCEAQNIDAKNQAAHRKLHGVDWAGIEHEYVHGDKSLNRISDIYGPSSTTISKYAKAGGWVRLVGTKKLTGGRKPRLPGEPRIKQPAAKIRRRTGFIKRLLRLLDNRLTAMEKRMADATVHELSALEIEREARAIGTLSGVLHKIIELEEAAKKTGKASKTVAVRSEEDADRLRRDLAQRLERLIPPRAE